MSRKTTEHSSDDLEDSLSHEKVEPAPGGFWRRYRLLPRNVVAIGLVSLLNDASSEIIYPLLPLFLTTTLGASPGAIGIIEGTAESISSLLKLFAGYLSDRRGRRKGLVVFGYALAGFSRPLLAFAQTWYQVLGVRLSDRIGKGIRTAPRDAMLADAVPIQERGLAFGFHRAMDHAGAVVGPLIGWLLIYIIASDRNALNAGDYRRIFLAASVPALAAVLVAAFVVREKTNAATPGLNPAKPPNLSLRGFDGNFKRFLIVVALFTLSNSTDAFLIKRANDAGVGIVYIPLLWAALHAVKVLSSLVGGNLSDWLGRRALIFAGWVLYAIVYCSFAFVTTPGAAWALFLIYGIYFGLSEGTEKALVADLVRPEKRGTAYGLYNLAFGVTVLPASVLMGALWYWRGAATAFLVSACIATLAAVLLLVLVSAVADESLNLTSGGHNQSVN